MPLYGLGCASDGTLYGAGYGGIGTTYVAVFRIAKSGDATRVATEYGNGFDPAQVGDLAIIGQHIIVTAGNELLFLDLATFKRTGLVQTRAGNLQGLAAHGTELFGFSSEGVGLVSRIDPATGHTMRLSSPDIEFLGAASR